MEKPSILTANLAVCFFGASAPTLTGLSPYVIAVSLKQCNIGQK